jgi:Intracellular proteinase inhibitor
VLFGLLLTGMLLGSTQCQNTTNDGTNSNGPIFVTTLAVEDANGNAASNFSLGEQIQFVLSVRNRTDSSQTISFNTSQEYNFEVLDSGTATEVWTWSVGKLFAQHTSSLTFQAGQTMTFTVTWDQVDDSNQAVASGNYEVIGGVTCINNSTSSSSSSSTSSTCMPAGIPTSDQLVPSVFISTLVPFTIQ